MVKVAAPPDPPAEPRVVMVVAQFWPIIGGVEHQAGILASELRRQGVQVEIWTGLWDPSWPRMETPDGITIRRLGPRFKTPLRRITRHLFTCSLFATLLRRRASFDLIHVHQVLYPAFIAALAGKILGRPSVARISSTGSTSDLVMSARGGLGIQRAITRHLLTRIVAVNAQAEAECLGLGYRRDQVVRIPNGVAVPDDLHVRTPGKDLEVLFLGGLRREKRIDVLIEAWKVAGRPGRLTIAGAGPEHDRLKAMAADCGDSIRFLGAVSDPDPLLEDADVLVLASDAEGMSNALLEAMAWGCACVATHIGGNIDLLAPEADRPPPLEGYLRGSAGLLVRPGDVVGLAKALTALHEQPQVRLDLGAAAHRRCRESYQLSDIARRYRNLYGSLLAPAEVSR